MLGTENFADLKCLLSELGSPEISCKIEDWDTGGRVFLDYITMIETLQQLQQVSYILDYIYVHTQIHNVTYLVIKYSFFFFKIQLINVMAFH